MATKKELKDQARAEIEAIRAKFKEQLDALPKGRTGEASEKTHEFAKAQMVRFIRRLGYETTCQYLQEAAEAEGVLKGRVSPPAPPAEIDALVDKVKSGKKNK